MACANGFTDIAKALIDAGAVRHSMLQPGITLSLRSASVCVSAPGCVLGRLLAKHVTGYAIYPTEASWVPRSTMRN